MPSAVLEHIKAQQKAEVSPEARRPSVQRTKFVATGRRNDSWNSLAARKVKLKAAAPGVAGQTSDP